MEQISFLIWNVPLVSFLMNHDDMPGRLIPETVFPFVRRQTYVDVDNQKELTIIYSRAKSPLFGGLGRLGVIISACAPEWKPELRYSPTQHQ